MILPRHLGRTFGDLKVRPKLMVLHNLFFLILTCAVYFSLIPLIEDRIESAWRREERLATRLFSESPSLTGAPGMEIYDFHEGDAQTLRIPSDAISWLNNHPDAVWHNKDGTVLVRKTPSALYRRLQLPRHLYLETLRRARWTLFIVLGLIYVLAVLTLEWFVMPLYVYRPLRVMLDADEATRRGDRDRELIDPAFINEDEIGQIMQSRNATVTELRLHEDSLEEALRQLTEIAEDLRRKNLLLETAKQNLAEQDRLVSLGMLSASVAHELNTPLSVLQGSIEKMLEREKDPSQTERLQRMLRVTQRLQKISETLVDFSRTRTQHNEPVAVRPLIEDAWNLVAINVKASGIRFENRTRESDTVMGNPDRLAQVFVNLLRNALYAVQSSGTIVVESRQLAEAGQNWVLIQVDDDGPGIPSNVLPNIFEAFVTTRLDARGTGLGLTVAEGIVHQHGGSIRASNRPGGGARLEVRLPAARRIMEADGQPKSGIARAD